mmetsp:Transcript_91017/g.241738  ORF Transcript_91017/g.241738 Transcript_91017/m.241738 type:complete len:212 (-) Transcript_91017:154-789(-)
MEATKGGNAGHQLSLNSARLATVDDLSGLAARQWRLRHGSGGRDHRPATEAAAAAARRAFAACLVVVIWLHDAHQACYLRLEAPVVDVDLLNPCLQLAHVPRPVAGDHVLAHAAEDCTLVRLVDRLAAQLGHMPEVVRDVGVYRGVQRRVHAPRLRRGLAAAGPVEPEPVEGRGERLLHALRGGHGAGAAAVAPGVHRALGGQRRALARIV